MHKIFAATAFCILFLGFSNAGNSGSSIVGTVVKPLTISDSNDKPKEIPFIGEYVITVFYTDPDVKDVNEPLSVALKEKNYPATKYKGVGIGNCSDTWLPNAAIRMGVRKKQEKYPGAVILLDQGKLVSKEWGLGDCDDAGVVIVIGKDKRIRYVKAVKTEEESKSIIGQVTKVIDQELAK